MALSFTPDGNRTWNGHIGKPAVSTKIEHIHITRPMYTHTPEMHTYVNQKTYMNVHSSIIHDFQKLETIQMP